MKAGLTIVAACMAAALIGSGCGHASREADGEKGTPSESRDIIANSVFGGVDVKEIGDMCAGRVQLVQGSATVNDACFTGDTNVVLCSDATSVSPVRCSAASGKLALAGTGEDLINYARVR